MGYNIEVSFNIDKNSGITEMQDKIKNVAKNCGCNSFHEDYEIDKFSKYKRNHYIIILNFSEPKIDDIIKLLEIITSMNSYYIEVIYDDFSNKIIYASNYYRNHQMIKKSSILCKEENRKRSYSEDDMKLMEAIELIKKCK